MSEVRSKDKSTISDRVVKKEQLGTSGELQFIGRKDDRVTSVIKQEYVEEEYEGYKKVKQYLPVLPTKRIVLDGVDSLIVKYIESEPLTDLINNNDPNAIEIFKAFSHDLKTMWESTKTKFNREKLQRDWGKVALDVIPKFKQSAIERLGVDPDVELIINGDKVGTINSYFEGQRKILSSDPPTMALAHGDENFDNVLVPTNTQEHGRYRVIDPRYAGYYDLGFILGNLYARMFLFSVDFAPDDKISIREEGSSAAVDGQQMQESSTASTVRGEILALIKEATMDNPDLLARIAAYASNNIGRSVGYLRDKRFRDVCERYGVQHFLQSMIELNRIKSLHDS